MSAEFSCEVCLPAFHVHSALAVLSDLAPTGPEGGTVVVLPEMVISRQVGLWLPFSNGDGRGVVDCSAGNDLFLDVSLLVEPDAEISDALWGTREYPPPGAVDESGRVALDSIVLSVRFTGYAPGYAVMRFTALRPEIGSTFHRSRNVQDMFVELTVAASGVCCGWEGGTEGKRIAFLNGRRVSCGVGGPTAEFRTMDDVAATWPVLEGQQNPTAARQVGVVPPSEHLICVGRLESQGRHRDAFVIDSLRYPDPGAFRRAVSDAHTELGRHGVRGEMKLTFVEYAESALTLPNWAEYRAQLPTADGEFPRYFEYYDSTYRIESTPDGGLVGYRLNLQTGRIEEGNSKIRKVLHARETEIFTIDEIEYIELTEALRAHYLHGDGPIFAVYDTVRALHDRADEESRRLTSDEDAFIRSIRRRTYRLWEEEFARQDGGAKPSFSYRSTR
ncbi:hypothetical protein [Nocardia wallacei]|uniref:hypothetical protein n=1 Tax=Nocardia wallacei TaxID=480035 RepID=UPI002458664B|nr:hypothetical protein [Nocardia wallacei]